MRLQNITQQGGQIYRSRPTGEHASKDTPEQRLDALAEYLAQLAPNASVWCHSAMSGLTIDAEDDYRSAFARVDWEGNHYRFEMNWPVPPNPANQHLVWAAAHARVIGFTPSLRRAAQMLLDVIAHAPRTSAAQQIEAIGRDNNGITLTPARADVHIIAIMPGLSTGSYRVAYQAAAPFRSWGLSLHSAYTQTPEMIGQLVAAAQSMLLDTP